MTYKVGWVGEKGYIVTSETGYHLSPFEVGAILNQEPADQAQVPNVIHKDGRYLIWIWKSNSYWSQLQHNGSIMLMDNPKVGTIATLPNSKRVKIIAHGTEHSGLDDPIQLSVFAKPWPEISIDGFIRD